MSTSKSRVDERFTLRLLVHSLIGIGMPAAWASATTYNVVTLPGGSQASGIDNGVCVGGGGGLAEAHFYGSPAIVWDASATATYLMAPPDSNLMSVATAISGSQVSGYLVARTPITGHENDFPAVWNRSTGAVTEMSGVYGEVLATDGIHQAGAAGGTNGMGIYAAYWSSPSANAMLLNPPSSFGSADGIDGNLVVGYVNNTAALWRISGATSTYSSLHPNDYFNSVAYGVSHGQIVGEAGIHQPNGSVVFRAALWTSLSASSFVPLTGNQITASAAYGTNGTQQVGYVSFDQPVNLIPPADHHAVVWNGTAESLQMLPLPKGFVDSVAYAIDRQGNVVGQMTQLFPGPVPET